jgi:hypothetical protein
VQARKGIMTLRDATNGTPMGAGAGVLPLPTGRYGTYPDWSPDGADVLFALSASNKTRGISAGSVARIPYANGAWGSVETLVASAGNTDNNYYPMYSFDRQRIAFVKANGSSDNNDTAKIYVLPAAGGTPVYPARLNQIVSNAEAGAAAKLGNSMPTWAPVEAGDYYFVAFTSRRAYGVVYQEGAFEQIWVAAIDPRTGVADPSFPAFRLPFQDLEENNHRPFWAMDALAPPPPPDAGVPPDAGPRDAGAPPDAPAACLDRGAPCETGTCCMGLVCFPNAASDYVCTPDIG